MPAALRDATEVGPPLLVGRDVLAGTFRGVRGRDGLVTAVAAWTFTGSLRFLVPLGPDGAVEPSAPVATDGRIVVALGTPASSEGPARIVVAAIAASGSLRKTALPRTVDAVAGEVADPASGGFLVWTAARLHGQPRQASDTCLAFTPALRPTKLRVLGCGGPAPATAIAVGQDVLSATPIPGTASIDVRAVSLGSGRTLWNRRLPGPLPLSWAGDGGVVLLVQAAAGEQTGDVRQSALDLASGRLLWTRSIAALAASQAVTDGSGLLECPPAGMDCTVRSLRTGRVLVTWPVEGNRRGSPGSITPLEVTPVAFGPGIALFRVTRFPKTGVDPSVLLLARTTRDGRIVTRDVPIRGAAITADRFLQGPHEGLVVTSAGVIVTWRIS